MASFNFHIYPNKYLYKGILAKADTRKVDDMHRILYLELDNDHITPPLTEKKFQAFTSHRKYSYGGQSEMEEESNHSANEFVGSQDSASVLSQPRREFRMAPRNESQSAYKGRWVKELFEFLKDTNNDQQMYRRNRSQHGYFE